DRNVTGVQTCALPISIFFINKIDQNGFDLSTVYQDIKEKLSAEIVIKQKVELYPNMCVTNFTESEQWDTVIEGNDDLLEKYMSEIGRASCRERVEMCV